ncbi:hypothetical protein BOH66_02655 [Microbacterium aurum]|uniref:Uncharacterized protein n=1 Tax=Microbacterium aurum TaxID=36805 RepID=A0A1P8U5C8_9MICO|nr:hypothetical protein [Microbacterium aurum]APZ33309.1 hypothetical protein BOH66_02655 [Microbacterium aurum]MBM7826930.1 ABC-type uncharacterized transport system YnjBCD permease subunit [Microbacterium aurum]
MTKRQRVAATALLAVAATLVGLGAYFALRWVFTAWNEWQFSLRPEVENWAVPSLGTELPAIVWACFIGAAVLAGGLIVIHTRSRVKESR